MNNNNNNRSELEAYYNLVELIELEIEQLSEALNEIEELESEVLNEDYISFGLDDYEYQI